MNSAPCIATHLIIALSAALVTLPAAAEAPLRLGRVVVMTGPLAPYGLAKNAGADLVYQQVNQAGGVKGRKIEVVSLDDNYDPKLTVQHTQQLIQDPSVLGLTGYVGVPTAGAVLETVGEAGIALIGPTSGTDALRSPFKRYVFPIRASYLDEATRSVGHLVGVGVKRIAVVFQTNPFGEIGRDAYVTALASAGIKPSAVYSVHPSGSDAATAADALAKSDAQAILFSGFTKPAGALIQALKKSSRPGTPVYALSAVDTTELLGALGNQAKGVVVSQVVPVPTSPTLPIVREYLRAIGDSGQTPSFYGLQGFIEAKVIVEAVRRAPTPLTRQGLVTALESLGELDVGGMTVKFTPKSREGARFVDLTVVGSEGQLRR